MLTRPPASSRPTATLTPSPPPPGPAAIQPAAHHRITPPAQRIALAPDTAFSFIYPHLLRGWRSGRGRDPAVFTPGRSSPRPDRRSVLAARRLPRTARRPDRRRRTLQDRPAGLCRTKPVHGECGGYMVLGAGLTDKAGPSAPDDRPSGPGNQLCRPQDAPRLPPWPTCRAHARPCRRHPPARPRIPLLHHPVATRRACWPMSPMPKGNAVPETGSQRGHVTGSFFHLIAEVHMTGFVSFVSSGPGDPDLLTVKALRLHRRSRRHPVMMTCRRARSCTTPDTEADLVGVGKRAGRASPKQDSVSQLLVDYALTRCQGCPPEIRRCRPLRPAGGGD